MLIDVTSANFETQILNSEKTVLLDFWATWCGPCQMIAPTVHEIADERADILVGKINVDDQPTLAQKFGIVSIPTLIVMKNGQIVNKAVGLRSKEQLLSML